MWLSICMKSDENQLINSNPMPSCLPFLFFLTSHSPPGLRWWIICGILAGSLSRVHLKGDGDTNENDVYISCLNRGPLSSQRSWFTETIETVEDHKQVRPTNEQRLKMSTENKMSGIRHFDQQMSVMLISCCQELSVQLTHRDRLDI